MADEHELHRRRSCAPACRRLVGATPRKSPFSSFQPVWPVASRTSLRRSESRGDRVAAVERDVGLVRAELLAVVRHVPAAVEVDRRERRVAEQPAADPVVGRRLRNSRRCAASCISAANCACAGPISRNAATHANGIVEPHREPDDAEGLHVHRDDADRVADRRDATEVVAQCAEPAGRSAGSGRSSGSRSRLGSGSIVIVEATGRCYTLQQMSRVRNITVPATAIPETGLLGLLERPLNARSVIGSLLLGVHPPRLPGARIVEWCDPVRHRGGHGPGRAEPHGRPGRARATTTGCTSWRAGFGRCSRHRIGAWRPRSGPGTVAGVSASSTAPPGTRRPAPRCGPRCAGSATERCARASGPVPTICLPPPRSAESWAVVDAQCSWWTGVPGEDSERFVDAARSRPANGRRGAVTPRAARAPRHLALGSGAGDMPRRASSSARRHCGTRAATRCFPPSSFRPRWPGDELRAYRTDDFSRRLRSMADSVGSLKERPDDVSPMTVRGRRTGGRARS